ncbi:hypothetical protein [Solitalea canadensis]|nr:hypothetical protein [Solitalea canadensis]
MAWQSFLQELRPLWNDKKSALPSEEMKGEQLLKDILQGTYFILPPW